jgi:hypothetical protein
MWRVRILAGAAALAAGVLWQAVASADAANGPAFRDCSLVGGIDPDFVQLTGVTVGAGDMVTVARGTKRVGIEASESADPGDSMGHVTLKVMVTSRHVPTQEVSGAGTGKVSLSLPLKRSRKVGRSYTISWSAVTDSGNHQCPSANTPENTTPMPFVVTVRA